MKGEGGGLEVEPTDAMEACLIDVPEIEGPCGRPWSSIDEMICNTLLDTPLKRFGVFDAIRGGEKWVGG